MKRYRITVNGQSYDVQVEELGGAAAPTAPAASSAQAPRPSTGTSTSTSTGAQASASAVPSVASTGAATIKAPMPGTLMTYKVAVGQEVRKGEVVLILEAMKMENEIVAPVDGKVRALGPAEGASVAAGEVLLELG